MTVGFSLTHPSSTIYPHLDASSPPVPLQYFVRQLPRKSVQKHSSLRISRSPRSLFLSVTPNVRRRVPAEAPHFCALSRSYLSLLGDMPAACLPVLRSLLSIFRSRTRRDMTHDLEQGEGAASVHRPTKRQKTSSAAAPPPPTMCCICRELLKPQDVAVSCTHCRFGIFCQDCLRDWFLKATVDETRMPVECCGDEIPVKKAKGFLTSEEVCSSLFITSRGPAHVWGDPWNCKPLKS